MREPVGPANEALRRGDRLDDALVRFHGALLHLREHLRHNLLAGGDRLEALAERKLALGALVFNKVLPTDLFSPEAAKVAERLDRDAGPVAAAVADEVPDTEQATRVLEEVAASFLNYRLVASRESEEAARLGVAAEVVATVPYLADDVHDLAGLLAIGRHLW